MELINTTYLMYLIFASIVSRWLFRMKGDAKAMYDSVAIFYTTFYDFYLAIPVLAIITSLIINIFHVGFLSTLCYFGILIGVEILNIFLYLIYTYIFGRTGHGILIALILAPITLVFMFLNQP